MADTPYDGEAPEASQEPALPAPPMGTIPYEQMTFIAAPPLEQLLRSIAASFDPFMAMAVNASLAIAARNWTVSDELQFGSVSREALARLLDIEVKFTK